MAGLPKLAVWKFSSCDGCQLSLLHCEEELLPLLGRIEIAYFPEATRTELDGPYDVSLVEGSVTTPEEAERIKAVRDRSEVLVAIGACATTGGIQALRNSADVDELARVVYAHPEYLDTLETSSPISAHVEVDHEIQGCPISRGQLLDTLLAILTGRRPNLPQSSVCMECKMLGTPCLMVTSGIGCLGPVTQAGCGALCPSYDRGCFGCYGPKELPNTAALAGRWSELGIPADAVARAFRTFTGNAPAFREESDRHG